MIQRIPDEFIKKSFEAKKKSDWEYIKKNIMQIM